MSWRRIAERIKNPSGKPRLPLDAAFDDIDDIKERLCDRRTQG